VPVGITSLAVEVAGAKGGNDINRAPGGTGRYTGGGYFGGGGGSNGSVQQDGGGSGSSYVAPTGTTSGTYGLNTTTDGSITLIPGTFVAQSVSNVPGDSLGNHTAT
jgi:hypothetical protein